ncbi:hypothetical protein EK21DRAFT_112268 [Setomelanomma holmii]|uniref:DUF7730 domain-containing protein n=1 Tax=Setomelanomma holmii TaxID=210430 RepID=A0A9P4H8D9_9PLEO|nr:hypothetical protein EK21DRAFT_112268 [Setomelanomma holmii]
MRAWPPTAKKRVPQKKKTTAVPTRVDNTTFPFLKLPGEIRNMIYTYLLVDQDHPIRSEAWISKRDWRGIVKRLFQARPGDADRDDLPGQQKGSITKTSASYKRFDGARRVPKQMIFAVHLLLICRQINNEAGSIFFGNNLFTFEAPAHLYTFLLHFNQRLPLVRKLGLAHYGMLPQTLPPASMMHTQLNPFFAILATAVNLEALYLNIPIFQSLSSKALLAAEHLFGSAHVWMDALAVKHSNRLAVLNVLKLSPISTRVFAMTKWSVSKDGQEEFRVALAAKLTRAWSPGSETDWARAYAYYARRCPTLPVYKCFDRLGSLWTTSQDRC